MHTPTEFLWCATSRRCPHLETGELSVCGSLIRPVTVARDLGVMLQSIAITVFCSERLSIFWIACNPSSMPLLYMLLCNRRKYDHVTPLLRDVYTGSQFRFESSSRSACWYTSRFMGQRLGICATIVRRRIRPLRGYDSDRRINAIFL